MMVPVVAIFVFPSWNVCLAHMQKLKWGSEVPGAAHSLVSSRNGDGVFAHRCPPANPY